MKHSLVPNLPTQLFLGGEWRDASDGATFDVDNPATEEVIATVASASVAGRYCRPRCGREGVSHWAARKPRERGEVLRKAFELIIAQKEDLARLVTLENGKALPNSRAEIAYAAEFFRWNAEEAVRNIGELYRGPSTGARILVHHKPAGIAVLVHAVEFSRRHGDAKDWPGACRRLSGHPETRFGDTAHDAGSYANSGAGRRAEGRHQRAAVEPLRPPRRRASCTIPACEVVSFTGSTEVGRQAAPRGGRQRRQSGHGARGQRAILSCLKDADVDAAVAGALIAKMRNIGEACTAANRFYVHDSVHDAFAGRLSEKMGAMKVGNGLEDGVEVGSLVNKETRDKVVELVEDAVKRGAKVLTGGSIRNGPGFFYQPTVLTDVPADARCFREEIFGPVAALARFSDEEDAVRRCNETEYGLVAYVFTKDVKRGLAFSERLDFGMIGLNRGLVSDPAAPFGGMKPVGHRP